MCADESYNWRMEPNLEDAIRTTAKLPERDRATLAGLLIASLDPVPDPDVEAAWDLELQRRLAEINDGTAKLVPWETVRRELFDIAHEG
jgi:putative addiction module component (TIGR02574 family)